MKAKESAGNHMLQLKKILIILVVFMLSAAVATLAYVYIKDLNRLKTVSYNDGKGTNYSLKFYPNNEVQEFKLWANSPVGMPNLPKQLVSKTSVENKAPIKIAIRKIDDKENIKFLEDCPDTRKAARVKHKASGQTVIICQMDPDPQLNNKSVAYRAVLTLNDKKHLVYIMQLLDQPSRDNKEQAAQVAAQAGIDPYLKDVKRIVPSIKIN